MRIVVALLCGALLGAGLAVSGMINPQKVLGFLDLGAMMSGGWDPSLALVMGGGLIVGFPLIHWGKTRTAPVCGGTMMLPTKREIDRDLVVGGLLFGVGWGLVGYCPGPAISALVLGHTQTIVFVIAMLAGMMIYRLTSPLLSPQIAARP